MAKKEKVQLTPEELEAKKARKKEKNLIFGKTFIRIWGWLLAILLVYSVTHIAFGPKPKVTVQAPTQQTVAPVAPSTNTGTSTETAAPSEDANSGSADAAFKVADAQAAADLLNKVTAAAADGKAGYDYSKKTNYTGDGMKLDSAIVQKGVNALLGALKPPTSIEEVVGGFIGVGEIKGKFAKGNKIGKDSENEDLKGYECLKASTIKAEDVESFSVKGNQLIVTLKDCKDPLRDDSTPLARFTGDFLNKGDVVEGLAAQDAIPATLNTDKTTISYGKTVITAQIEKNQLVALKCTFPVQAEVTIQVSKFGVHGTGSVERTITYSNFTY